MKRDLISLALNGMDDRFISEAMVFHPEVIQETPERIVRMRTKRIISIALAAALILALGVVAYATDLFGLRALLIKNDNLNQDGGTNSGHAFAHSDILVHLIPIVQYWFPCRNLSELRFYRKDNCGLWHRIIPQPICFIMKRIMTNDSKNGKIASARVWRVLNDYER